MRNASRRSADSAQLDFYVESTLAKAQRAFGERAQPADAGPVAQVYAPGDLERFRAFWAEAAGEGANNARAVMKQLEERTAYWRRSPIPEDKALIDLNARFPNFSAAIDQLRWAAALSQLEPGGPLMMPTLLLDGPPGIGKSRFAREVALVLQVPMLAYTMTQTTSSFSLGGLNSQFAGGGPGDLVRSLASLGVPDALIVVDEIDKAPIGAAYDPRAPLYDLLESSTAERFVDDGLRMPLNLGGLRWICTCNDVELVPEPLRSRCIHLEIEPPTSAQMRDIVARAYRDILEAGQWAEHFDSELPADVLEELSAAIPRDLTRVLRGALGAAALEMRSTIRVDDMARRHRRRAAVGFT